MPIADFMLIGGGLIILSLSASVVAGPIRVPALLFFLGIGMVLGSDGLGWIEFNDYELARNVGIVALSLILFEGGLSAGFSSLRGVARSAISLATIGTLITAMITGQRPAPSTGY